LFGRPWVQAAVGAAMAEVQVQRCSRRFGPFKGAGSLCNVRKKGERQAKRGLPRFGLWPDSLLRPGRAVSLIGGRRWARPGRATAPGGLWGGRPVQKRITSGSKGEGVV
jgi:hypothetical protein